MFASAPIFGVGVGRYFERSPEFMPDEIRELYGAENAHNYFAQSFAELGIAGGATVPVARSSAGMTTGWRQAATARAESDRNRALCRIGRVSRHVPHRPPASSCRKPRCPFWAAFGVLAMSAGEPGSSSRYRVVIAIVIVLARSRARPLHGGLRAHERGSVPSVASLMKERHRTAPGSGGWARTRCSTASAGRASSR